VATRTDFLVQGVVRASQKCRTRFLYLRDEVLKLGDIGDLGQHLGQKKSMRVATA